MLFDITERAAEAREFFDELLTRNIKKISEISGIPTEQFKKINPVDFLERNKYQAIQNYTYQDIGEWITKNKTDETFLINPTDAVEETAAQVSYKSYVKITRSIRASKCQVMPVPKNLAKDFFIRNHRQSQPLISSNSVCYGLAYNDELVAVMLYDISAGAVRGRNKNYELVRLSISKGTQIHGGASKLQGACEATLWQMGITRIYSYSNATINTGAVYQKLGFSGSFIESGQPFVILGNNKIERLINLYPVSTNRELAKHGWMKCHLSGNRMWTKTIIPPERKENG